MSATMQSVQYLQLKFPHHDFNIVHVAQSLPRLEKNQNAFNEVIDKIKTSDGVLWGFPVYVCLVHSNYKRFIELIFERGVENVFKGKYTAAISTSIHFFDHTAHNYIRAICDDLNMKYVDFFAADMYDLMDKNERDRLISFGAVFFNAIESKVPTTKWFPPLEKRQFDYVPGEKNGKIDLSGKKLLILTDLENTETNLGKMINKFKGSFSSEVEVVNLHNIDIKGGCLGCIRCGITNICAYHGKDEYMEFYDSKIKTADILVLAGTLKDRYLSSRWKLYFDRSFYNTHMPTLKGKTIGVIISGPLGQVPNLVQIFQVYFESQEAKLADIVTDEFGDSTHVDALLENLAKKVVKYHEMKYFTPMTFLAIGGLKVFRDCIYGRLRVPFQADHRYYKRHGFYDFPKKPPIAERILILMSKSARFREIFYDKIIPFMIRPHQKVLKKEKAEMEKSAKKRNDIDK